MNCSQKDKPFKALSKRQKRRRIKKVWKFINTGSESKVVSNSNEDSAVENSLVLPENSHCKCNMHDLEIKDLDFDSTN